VHIITTKDGSDTLYSEQFNEIYHSGNGAIQESQHVFIQHGLDYVINSLIEADSTGDNLQVKIFEMGFGTGLNALLTMLEAEKRNVKIDYETIELYPVPVETIKALNYTQILGYEHCYGPYHTMHLMNWNETHTIAPNFTFKKIKGSLIDYQLSIANYQLIYFDAFAPEQQPELWTSDIMRKIYSILSPNGILVSYSSKSAFQKALKEVGFTVEKIPGPPGKREMVRAHKK